MSLLVRVMLTFFIKFYFGDTFLFKFVVRTHFNYLNQYGGFIINARVVFGYDATTNLNFNDIQFLDWLLSLCFVFYSLETPIS